MNKKQAAEKIKERYLEETRKYQSDRKLIVIFNSLLEEAQAHGLDAYTELFQGYVAWKNIDYESALSHYKKAIEIDATLPYPYNGLGNVHIDKKQYNEAIKWYKLAIEKDAEFAYPYIGLGNVYWSKMQYDKAFQWYKLAIEKAAEFSFPYIGVGNVHATEKQYDKAIQWYKLAIEKDAEDPSPYNNLGAVYGQLKQYDEAIKCYELAIEKDAEVARSHYGLGLAHEEKGELGTALQYHKNAKELFSEQNDDAWVSIVESAIKRIEEQIKAQSELQKELQKGQTEDPLAEILDETVEIGKDVDIKKESFYNFLSQPNAAPDEGKYIQILRRWNSYTPIIADNYHISKGGGYFLKVGSTGIVIDPGFNFIDNFKGEGHKFHDITTVFISHAHNDHTSDYESINTLLHKYNERVKKKDDESKEDTVRVDISKRDGKKFDEIKDEDIEREFLVSPRRKNIDIFTTASVRHKFTGMSRLRSTENYTIHTIEPSDRVLTLKDRDGKDILKYQVIRAKHDDIISDRHSVGLVFEIDGSVLVYTGDTGWNPDIEAQYKEIKKQYKNRQIVLIAHLGGFARNEERYTKDPQKRWGMFYKNHLGRHGLAMLCLTLEPNICFISEFGEEFKNHRIRLAEIFDKAINKNRPVEKKIHFLPADIGLKYDFDKKMIEVISEIDLERFMVPEHNGHKFVKPTDVKVCLLRKDYSLHYYAKEDARDDKFTEADLIQVLMEDYDRRTIHPHYSEKKGQAGRQGLS